MVAPLLSFNAQRGLFRVGRFYMQALDIVPMNIIMSDCKVLIYLDMLKFLKISFLYLSNCL